MTIINWQQRTSRLPNIHIFEEYNTNGKKIKRPHAKLVSHEADVEVFDMVSLNLRSRLGFRFEGVKRTHYQGVIASTDMASQLTTFHR